jgi:hypothetical protein
MKDLVLISIVLFLFSCKKSSDLNTGNSSTTPVNNTNNSSKNIIGAKINDRQWKSAAKTTSDSNTYLAAINSGNLQIKTYGTFTDASGTSTNDQLGIYIGGVTDTGTYTLSMSNYIAYNQLSATPQYFSSQLANVGFVRITSITDTTISGTFECQVNNTADSGSIWIKEGTFSNVMLQ